MCFCDSRLLSCLYFRVGRIYFTVAAVCFGFSDLGFSPLVGGSLCALFPVFLCVTGLFVPPLLWVPFMGFPVPPYINRTVVTREIAVLGRERRRTYR